MHRIAASHMPRHRGAISIMMTGFLFLAIACLVLVIDSGRLFYEKRKLQRFADLAAIEAVSRGATCFPVSNAKTVATEAVARQGLAESEFSLAVACGDVETVNGERQLLEDPSRNLAIRVDLQRAVAASLIAGGWFGNDVVLSARATAQRGSPLAALTLRSRLLEINTANSALLNPLLGGLLGGGAGVNVLSWDGLLGAQVDLLQFLDALKINLGLSAGGYEEVLSTGVSVGQVATAIADVLPASGNSSAVVSALNAIAAGANLAPTNLRLGELLDLQTSTGLAGAATAINVFDLILATAQLANHENAAAADVPISLPLELGNVTLNIKVIEPPQVSAIGNPALAKADPLGANRLQVRTAQTRLLLSAQVPSLTSLLNEVLATVLDLASPVVSLLQSVFSNLFGCVEGCTEIQTRPEIFPGNPLRIDIGLDLGGASSHVVDYSCQTGAKKLTAETSHYAAKALVGQINAAQFFDPLIVPSASLIPVLDVYRRSRRLGPLGVPLEPWSAESLWTRTGLVANTTVAGAAPVQEPYSNPPDLGKVPGYRSFSSTNVVNSLLNTLSGLSVETYTYNAGEPNGMDTTSPVGQLNLALNGTIAIVKQLISTVLSPLLDPLLNGILKALGIDLGEVDVGHNLSCDSLSGVTLVN